MKFHLFHKMNNVLSLSNNREQNYKKFNLIKMLDVYKRMFKDMCDYKYYMLIGLINFFYRKTNKNCIISKKKLNKYIYSNFIKGFNELKDINSNIAYEFYKFLTILQFLSYQSDEIILNYEYLEKNSESYYTFQKYRLSENSSKIKYENYFFDMVCYLKEFKFNSPEFKFNSPKFITFFYAEDDKYNLCCSEEPIFYELEDKGDVFLLKYSNNMSRLAHGCYQIYKKQVRKIEIF